MDKYQDFVKELHGKAGDALIFCESCIHGTMPWTGKQQRRAILNKYNASREKPANQLSTSCNC